MNLDLVPKTEHPPSTTRTTIEIVDGMPRFAALRAEWSELLHVSTAGCPFLSWEWAYAWWTHLRGSSELRLLVVRAGKRLIGIAPLRLSRGRLPWFSRLEFLGTGFAGSDYLDLIVRPGFEAEVLQVLSRSLALQSTALRLTHLPPQSVAAPLAELLQCAGWTSRSAPSGLCPFITLKDHSWESYLSSRGSSHRANFRRRLKALDRDFHMRVERVASESTRAGVIASLASFHDRRWGTQGGSTAFQGARLQAFHDDVTCRAFAAGWLRLYALYLDGRMAAAMYGFLFNGRFYFYQHGFDPRYERYSVGLVLMGLTIRAAIEEGAIEFDMLYGAEPYKRLWASEQRRLTRLDLFPARFGGRVYQRKVEAESMLRALARRVLARDADAA